MYHLFSKNTHKEFSYGSMAAMLVIYFVMACWSAGTYISSGLVVPMLLIGGLYGRMVGVLFVDLFGIQGRRRRRDSHLGKVSIVDTKQPPIFKELSSTRD